MQSKTIRNLVGLLGFVTTWCGGYHLESQSFLRFSLGTISEWPLLRYPFSISGYLTKNFWEGNQKEDALQVWCACRQTALCALFVMFLTVSLARPIHIFGQQNHSHEIYPRLFWPHTAWNKIVGEQTGSLAPWPKINLLRDHIYSPTLLISRQI